MNSGWRFSVTVPSWTQTTLEGQELVVFYRVEVKVLPPEEEGAPRTRSVLRRFSHFQKLHRMLKEEFGGRKLVARELPPKWSLLGVNKKPDLIEKRRRELEVWLWKLISDPDIARSAMLNNFLELSDAARMVTRGVPSPAQSGASQLSAPSSYGRADGVSFAPSDGQHSDFHDESGSEASYAATGSTGTAEHPPDLHTPGVYDRSDGAARRTSLPLAAERAVSEGGGGGGGGGGGVMRLGLRMEQRGTVKKQVQLLRQRLDRAASDLQDAIEALRTEQETKRELAQQLQQLQAHSASGGVGADNDLELSATLAQERQQLAETRQALSEKRERTAHLQARALSLAGVAKDAGRLWHSLHPASPHLQALCDEEPTSSQAQPLSLELERQHNGVLQDRVVGLEDEVQRLRAAASSGRRLELTSSFSSPQRTAPGSAAGEAAEELQAAALAAANEANAQLEQENEELAAKVEESQAALDAFREETAANEAKSRADKKLLAKEVKSLRKLLEQERLRADTAEQQAAQPQLQQQPQQEEPTQLQQQGPEPGILGGRERARILAEVAALRQRLEACSLEALSAGGAGPSGQPQGQADAQQLLQTSDDRIHALTAEARLLPQNGASASTDDAETEVRQAFADVLSENAVLRRQVNQLLRASNAASANVPQNSNGAQRDQHEDQLSNSATSETLTHDGPAPSVGSSAFSSFASRFKPVAKMIPGSI